MNATHAAQPAPATTAAATVPPVSAAAPDHVFADLTYEVDQGVKPQVFINAPGTDDRHYTGRYEQRRVPVHNARPIARELSLDRQGFALTRHDSAVSDFRDDEEVRAVYYPEMERLVKAATGAKRVVVFDHNVRVDGAEEAGEPGVRTGVRYVHNDYTAKSGPQRVRDLLGEDEAGALLHGRFAVINVWRPIRGPVERAPLALADAGSVAPQDLKAVDLVYPDRTGEIYHVAYNPEHRWYYVPDMESDEALLIKGYDSADDGRARFTPHTAFDDPGSPRDAAPRESIEVRTLVFY